MIYFNQATTSYPKPQEVIDEMVYMMKNLGGSAGRGSDERGRKTENIVKQTREKLAKIFGASDSNKVVFTQNATAALNQAIKGLPWKKGDHIITSTFEHNSVRRPIHYIKETYQVDVTYINPLKEEDLVATFEAAITENTKAIAVTHACNVTGDVLPIKQIGKLAKKHNIYLIVDGSQSAGHLDINMQEDGISMLAFPAHKSLLGPQGIGILLVEGEVELNPLLHGGTGVFSEEITQPTEWPYRFESGTLNTPAVAGLYAALQLYEQQKEENVSRETFLYEKMYNGLKNIEGVTIYKLLNQEVVVPTIAFNIKDVPSQEIATILDSTFQISVRAGIHCNPLCHESYGTIEHGMVRASINASNTEEEVQQFLFAIEQIASSY